MHELRDLSRMADCQCHLTLKSWICNVTIENNSNRWVKTENDILKKLHLFFKKEAQKG